MPINPHPEGTLWLGDEQFTEGVEDARFAFGPDRVVLSGETAPGFGVKVRRGNPTQSQAAMAAATVGYQATDMVFTIWASTLGSDDFKPKQGDIIIIVRDGADVERWIVKSCKTVIYGSQYVCMCAESPTNLDTVR